MGFRFSGGFSWGGVQDSWTKCWESQEMLEKMIALDSNEISFCPQGKGNASRVYKKPWIEKEFDKAISLSLWRFWVGELF